MQCVRCALWDEERMRIGPAHVEAEAHDRIQRASIRGGGSDHIANDTNNTRHNASKVHMWRIQEWQKVPN